MSDLPRFEAPTKITAVLWYYVDGEYRGVAYESRDIEVGFDLGFDNRTELTLILKEPGVRESVTLLEEK